MKALSISAIAAGVAGLGLGYLTGSQDKVERPGVGEPETEAKPALRSKADIAPHWRPGIEAELDAAIAAEGHEGFRDLVATLLLEVPKGTERDEWLHRILAEWVARDGAAAVKRFNDYRFWGEDRELRSALHPLGEFMVHRLALNDLDAALGAKSGHAGWSSATMSRLIAERYPGRVGEFVDRNAFAGDAADWKSAGRLIGANGEGGLKLLEKWVRANNVHRSRSSPALFAGAVAGLVETMSPEEILTWADGLAAIEKKVKFDSIHTNPSESVRIALAEHLVEADLELAVELAGGGDRALACTVAERLAETDLAAAMALLEPFGRGGRLPSEPLRSALSRLSLSEAVTFLGENDVYTGGYEYMRANGEERAAEMIGQLATMPSSSGRDELLTSAFTMLSRQAPDVAIQHGFELLGSDDAAAVSQQLVWALAARPDHLFEFADAVDPEGRESWVQGVARMTGPKDPRESAAVVVENIDHPLAPTFAAELVERWANNGLRGASGWLAEVPEGAVRDAGATALVGVLAPQDPEGALIWSATIGDAELRRSSLSASLSNWANDPAGALQALDRIDIPDEDRASLRAQIEDPEGTP